MSEVEPVTIELIRLALAVVLAFLDASGDQPWM